MKLNFQVLSDNELVSRYQHQNCESSITELVLRHKDKIYTHIYFIIKDHYLAEDILQETLVKAAQNIKKGKYTDQGKFAPWVSRIAHNLCIDYIRKSKSSHAIRTISNDALNMDIGSDNHNGNKKIETKETNHMVWRLINQLPEEQMEVVVMRIYGELSFKEISDAMGVSINTSLGRMRYALINLRKMINEHQLVLR